MKRHALDPVSLVFGLMLTGLGLAFLVARIDIANTNLRWVWPLPLLALGALMIVLGARRTTETATSADDARIPG
jgi:cytochrome c-type biogenesis protein CcmH/NrfF